MIEIVIIEKRIIVIEIMIEIDQVDIGKEAKNKTVIILVREVLVDINLILRVLVFAFLFFRQCLYDSKLSFSTFTFNC